MDQDQEIQLVILNILADHRGFESRCPKKLLLRQINQRLPYKVGDRRMRSLIEDLRTTEKGAYICASVQGKGGYFLATSKEELDRYTKSDLNRAYNLLYRVKQQRKYANLDTSPQMELFQ